MMFFKKKTQKKIYAVFIGGSTFKVRIQELVFLDDFLDVCSELMIDSIIKFYRTENNLILIYEG